LIFDGVPPRAKMDNQRSARFRYSRSWNKLDQALAQDGFTQREKFLRKMMITPGTEFSYELDEQMKYFIKRKITEDDNWKKVL
jgi:5'-3' exoribonuclease 1